MTMTTAMRVINSPVLIIIDVRLINTRCRIIPFKPIPCLQDEPISQGDLFGVIMVLGSNDFSFDKTLDCSVGLYSREFQFIADVLLEHLAPMINQRLYYQFLVIIQEPQSNLDLV